MSTLAVLVIFQPFVDLADAIIGFFEETVGLSWGMAIVALTFTVRLLTLPLSLTGSGRCGGCSWSRRSSRS